MQGKGASSGICLHPKSWILALLVRSEADTELRIPEIPLPSPSHLGRTAGGGLLQKPRVGLALQQRLGHLAPSVFPII